MDFNKYKFGVFCLMLHFYVSKATGDVECSDNCLHLDDEKPACDLMTKACMYGCQNGFSGPDCSLECKTCKANESMRCSGYCHKPKGPNILVCNVTSGQCLYGCVKGTYWGENCTNICNTECQGQKCDFKTGECTHGGFKGRNCNERKKSGLADWEIAVIVIGIVAGLSFIFLVNYVLCKVMKRNYDAVRRTERNID
ncbi:cell death abnormality protein 1-like [Mercenaria mercenaria]|uniref:cell death abnormality protein 1-like n=1 Tax=Mercenaria mercenaria TaxID=6596 RepID=UPI001E1D4FEE|nr:cell death abnormality protein 1-like [Mercenaria mercenaria]